MKKRNTELILRIILLCTICFSLFLSFFEWFIVEKYNNIVLSDGSNLIGKISAEFMGSFIALTIVKFIFIYKIGMSIIKKKTFKIKILKILLITLFLAMSFHNTYNIIHISIEKSSILNKQEKQIITSLSIITCIQSIIFLGRYIIYLYVFIACMNKDKNIAKKL